MIVRWDRKNVKDRNMPLSNVGAVVTAAQSAICVTSSTKELEERCDWEW